MQSRLKPLFEGVLCLAVLAGLPLLILAPALGGEVFPMALDGALAYPPWQVPEGAETSDTAEPAAPPAGLSGQQVLRYYPWMRFLQQSTARGDSLWWYPLEGGGLPFAALWEARAFSPFTLPVYLSGLAGGLALSYYLKLLVAGLTALYAALRFGLSRPLGLFVAVAFQCSGAVLGWLPYPEADTLVWLPLLVLAVELLVLGFVRAWPMLAFVVAMMGLGGSPGAFAAALVVAALMMLLRLAPARENPHRGLAAFAVLLGVLVGSALQALPLGLYVEYLTLAAAPSAVFDGWQPGAALLAALTGFVAPAVAHHAPAYLGLALGVVPLLLLPLWFGVRDYMTAVLRGRVETLLLVTAVGMAGTLLFADVLAGVPFLGHVRAYHFAAFGAFAVALMGGAAAHAWLMLNVEPVKRVLARLLWLTPLVWVALLAAALMAAVTLGTGAWAIGGLVAAAVAVFVLVGLTVAQPRPSVLGYGLAVAVLVAGCAAALPHRGYTAVAQVFPKTPFLETLRTSGERVSGSEALGQWPLAASGLAQVYTPSGIRLARYADYVAQTKEQPLLLRRVGSPKLLLTKQDIQGAFVSVRPALSIEKVFAPGAILFDDSAARPRAWVTYSGRPVERFDPAALSPDAPPLLEGITLPETTNGVPRAARITEESNAKVVVETPRGRPGVLVLADTWYPGWQATVNGEAAPIVPVDGLFRGVELSEGEHEVVFFYEPHFFWPLLVLTGAAFVVWLIGLQGMLRPARRPGGFNQGGFDTYS